MAVETEAVVVRGIGPGRFTGRGDIAGRCHQPAIPVIGTLTAVQAVEVLMVVGHRHDRQGPIVGVGFVAFGQVRVVTGGAGV